MQGCHLAGWLGEFCAEVMVELSMQWFLISAVRCLFLVFAKKNIKASVHVNVEFNQIDLYRI